MDYEKLFSSKMDELLIEEMQKQKTPGMSIGIVEDAEYIMSKTYGTKDFERNEPVNSKTLFCIASVTKSFICSGILKLQEEEKLHINDPISDYLPITLGDTEDPITIFHLMTHSSGIPNLADGMWARNRETEWGFDTTIPRWPFSSWEDCYRFVNGADEYLSKPGTRFHYNNLGYGFLSKIITEVAGESYKKYIRKKIFDPLNMNRTGFYSEINDDDNISKAYTTKPKSDPHKWIETPYEDIRLTRSVDEAAGGLFSNVEELSNYMIMNLNNGEFGGRRILSENSITEMQKRQFKEEYPNSPFSETYILSEGGYGFGLVIDEDFYGTKLVQHSGSFLGASSWFAFLPKFNRGITFLSNHHPSPRIFAQSILIESLGKNVNKEWQILKIRKHHERLSGKYETYKGLNKVKVNAQGGQLYLTTTQDQQIPLIEKGNNLVTLNYYHNTETGGRMPVQFKEDNDSIWLHIERNKWKKVD